MRGLLIATAAAPAPLDPAKPYRLSPRVGLRPEPFGALAYHFDSRRLVFLKSADLVELVRTLAEHPSLGAAIDAAVPDARRGTYTQALQSLATAGVICER